MLRAHGLRGDVVARYVSDRPERRAEGAMLSTPTRTLTIERAKALPGGGSDVLVHFAGVDDRVAAEALRGTVLLAEPIDDPDELWVHDLIGARVIDQDGVERGVVREVHDGAASDLLLLDDGHVVPVTFVVAKEPGVVRVDTPDGLFDL